MLYSFADYALDEGARLLRRAGRDVPLQPKVLDLLLLLIRHRSHVVSQRVLLRELWPDTVVTEASLKRLVKELRRALGDDGRRQGVIRTRRAHGYAFVAEVRVGNGDGSAEQERVIELARSSLEAAVELGGRDLLERVREFALLCEHAVRSARRAVAPARDGA
jgi:DNA-binding winged helix-turn-helix (wHTH) protein